LLGQKAQLAQAIEDVAEAGTCIEPVLWKAPQARVSRIVAGQSLIRIENCDCNCELIEDFLGYVGGIYATIRYLKAANRNLALGVRVRRAEKGCHFFATHQCCYAFAASGT